MHTNSIISFLFLRLKVNFVSVEHTRLSLHGILYSDSFKCRFLTDNRSENISSASYMEKKIYCARTWSWAFAQCVSLIIHDCISMIFSLSRTCISLTVKSEENLTYETLTLVVWPPSSCSWNWGYYVITEEINGTRVSLRSNVGRQKFLSPPLPKCSNKCCTRTQSFT